MLKNVVVIGGSYVGTNLAEKLAAASQGQFRVLLIEKNSHFQHLFAFPRFAVTKAVDTHKAFIPYQAAKFGGNGAVLQAAVMGLTKTTIQLDRKVLLDGQQRDSIPFEYLALTTGTKLSPPSTLPGGQKMDGVTYLREHATNIERSRRIVIIGAGAVGVQTATDIKELYPEKLVTLVHSRKNMMNTFHSGFHDIVEERCRELGIDTVLGTRVKLPSAGFPVDGNSFDVELTDGTKIPADFAIICTGQIPQSGFLQTLVPQVIKSNGFISVQRTLQIDDAQYPNIFALGDVADTGAHKAARPAARQAEVVAANIQHLINQEPLEEYEVTGPPAIHMSLGIKENVVFANPPKGSDDPPMIKRREDGTLDMGIDGVWTRRGGGADAML